MSTLLFGVFLPLGKYSNKSGGLQTAKFDAPMKFNLPSILLRYFEAQNAHDIEAMVACFAPDATVRDEGRTIIGSEAIRAWKKETSLKYHITAEPFECRVEADCNVAAVKVSGNFPGSPANLTYRFGFSADGRINKLEVR